MVDELALEANSSLQILDTYLDTDDWRFHRAGFALRIRSQAGKSEATLKSLHSASTEYADRLELSQPLETDASESIQGSAGPVGTRVSAVRGTHALVPLFEVRTARQRFAVRRQDDAHLIGEIALDETVIARPNGEPRTNLQRVEVEALTDVQEPLQSLVNALQNGCALERAADSKYSQGLQSVGLVPGPSPAFVPITIDASMTVVEVALANLRCHVAAWHQHEPGARLGDDAEELHDLRLAVRRVDATVRQFREFLPAPLLRIRPTLKKLLRALGAVRDLDVALEQLERFGRNLRDSEQQNLTPLRQHLLLDRDKARARMLETLDSDKVHKALQKLTTSIATPAPPSPTGAAPLALAVLPDLIRRRYRKMRTGAAHLTRKSSTEAFHAVRGRSKKLRYALEAAASLCGKPADQMLSALRRWQDKLGVQQDAAVASQRLKALAAAPRSEIPAATVFLMGRLDAHYERTAAQSRKVFSKSYQRVCRRWKKLRFKLENLAAMLPPTSTDETP